MIYSIRYLILYQRKQMVDWFLNKDKIIMNQSIDTNKPQSQLSSITIIDCVWPESTCLKV